MRGVINGNASGVWAAEEGTPVEVVDYKANGRAVLVQMPEDARLAQKAGRRCWIPRRWVDGEARRAEDEEPFPLPLPGSIYVVPMDEGAATNG